MLRDVFYYGSKPNVHPREQYAENLEDARKKCTTEHFWVINEFCDYRNFDWDFDFEFLPDEDVWAEEHNNVWPSQHQKDSGTWLCPKEYSELIIYRGDVDPIIRKNEKQSDNWVELDLIDHTKFDFSWHPDPTDPPYIYKWGCKFYPAQLRHVLEYHVPGATQEKYMDTIVELLPLQDNWVEHYPVDKHKFDMSWRPNPLDPPFIYVWGNHYFDGKTAPTLEYNVPGASDIKHMPELLHLLPDLSNWEINEKIEMDKFDFAWRPNPKSPPYIYVWGNQWNTPQEKISVQYKVDNATEFKYMETNSIRKAELSNWLIPDDIDTTGFDFSWEPNPHSPAYIYEFATQWQKTGGPQYIVPGAKEKQYVDFQKVKKLPSFEGWTIPNNIDIDRFDFSWHPDSSSPPYVYVFATQWAFTGGPVYAVPGATEFKYIDDQIATAVVSMDNWEYDIDLIDIESFDFSWHPYAEDQPYIYQFGTQWQKTGGPRYITPGSTGNSPVKYIDTRILKATRLPNKKSFTILNDLVVEDFDYSWHPDETEEPYIYVFGNNQYPAEIMPTIEYKVDGADQVKYIRDTIAKLGEDKSNWIIHEPIDSDSFDFSWKPNPNDPPYIYVFGNQYFSGEIYPTVEYHTPNAVEKKYIDTIVAKLKSDKSKFKILHPIIEDRFDFSWRPNPLDPAYIYVFGNNLYSAEEMPTVEYHVEGATERKYISDIFAHLSPNMKNWEVPNNIDTSSFDFSWIPHPKSPPYIYEFATVWNNRGGPKYIVPEATEYKYIEDVKAKLLPSRENWELSANVNANPYDFSWVPHPDSPPYIYQFGTLVNDVWIEDGPRYVTPGNDGFIVRLENSLILSADVIYPRYYIETTLEELVSKHPTETFWALNKNINYETFDFSWKPEKENLFNVTVFGSPESETTHTYFVNAPLYLEGHTSFNYIEENLPLDENYLSKLFVKPDMFFVDRGNAQSAERFELLKEKFGNKIQKTRYLNSWVDTINRCINRSTTELIWVLNSELDYSNFNFDYYPNPWQMKMVHVFGTQWSHWGTTFLVNSESFPEDTKYIKIIEHLSMLNFVKEHRAIATNCVYDIVLIDHENDGTSDIKQLLETKAKDRNITVVKYNDSYLNTIKQLVNKLPDKKEHYLWLCSSVCDYNGFDLSYICDPFAKDNLHVFPSGRQKFGDTFLIDVNKTKEIINELESLEDYYKVNYNNTMRVERLPAPEIVTSNDTLVEAVKTLSTLRFPYGTIVTEDNKDLPETQYEPINLWAPDTKNIIVTTTGNSRIIAPKEVSDHVKKELYDYPYIKRAPKLVKSNPMDIVFLSNGESCADEHYEHLLKVTEGLSNRVVRVDGVNGRAKAYHAAAEASETPWMFTVFAKLKVSPKFDWNWQPDRMQVPKHYIFHAKNPVNGLTYGHQAMIAYNKKLTLANEGRGLDFTLDDEHEIVPLISGTAHYNTDPFSTWRTAFREVLKLKADDSEESRVRLDAWLNKAEGDYSEYSIKGALDAEEYYEDVEGDFDKLKLSYEWAWLRKRFDEL